MKCHRRRSLYGRALGLAKDAPAVAAALVILLSALVLGGCASAPTAPPPDGMDEMTPPEILYQAAVSTYESRDIPVEVASQKFMIVTSEYAPVSPQLRKRMSTRVVRTAPGAIGLKVTAEWERRYMGDGEEQWRAIDTEELRERAKPEELALARAIEERFEDWKKEWKADREG